MFEKAARLKLRFGTGVGKLSVEDLWDLPLTTTINKVCLDNIARALNRALKDGDDESFVVKRSATDSVLVLKFEIVKHVIAIKLEEREAKSKAVEKKARKEQILNILADKENESLKGMSADELKALIDKL